MELLFIALGGAVLGLAARYALPGRQTHGAVLVPAIGTMVAAVVWVALTWFGLPWDGGWIWWVTLGVTALASVAADLALERTRSAGDERMLHALMRDGHPSRA
jgi:ABC-type branched-subunit amino acid transport system permease subunit